MWYSRSRTKCMTDLGKRSVVIQSRDYLMFFTIQFSLDRISLSFSINLEPARAPHIISNVSVYWSPVPSAYSDCTQTDVAVSTDYLTCCLHGVKQVPLLHIVIHGESILIDRMYNGTTEEYLRLVDHHRCSYTYLRASRMSKISRSKKNSNAGPWNYAHEVKILGITYSSKMYFPGRIIMFA